MTLATKVLCEFLKNFAVEKLVCFFSTDHILLTFINYSHLNVILNSIPIINFYYTQKVFKNTINILTFYQIIITISVIKTFYIIQQ